MRADLRRGLDVLAQQPLLVERVAGLPRDGVDGALVDLLLDCTQQQEERLAHRFLEITKEREGRSQNISFHEAFFLTTPPPPPSEHHLEVAVHADGHPVGEHLLHDGLGAPQHQLGVLGGRGVDQVHQQVLHDAGVVLQLTVEGDGEQRRQAASEGWRREGGETDEQKQTRPRQRRWSVEG